MSLPPSASEAATSQGFESLHPKVQKWIWDKGWTELRDIQEQAIHALLGPQQDIILAAATASGKTEAAFIPISSRLAFEPDVVGVRALYLSPLKALINDQFSRLTELFEVLDIPVHRWHGDVSQHHKTRLLKQPSGILLMTPESLEALFIRNGQSLRRIFGQIEAVVIDELHAFIGSERGCQLQSLLARLEFALGRQVPRIGLSATLGDMQLAAKFLRPESKNPCLMIQSQLTSQGLMLQLRGTRVPPKPKEQATDRDEDEETEVYEHIYTHLRGSTNLIFANRRSDVEVYTDALNRLCRRRSSPEEFVAHHGSLSKALREDAEARLKEQSRPVTAVCTSTLEMGIDIGQVHSVAQIGCPPSVASLRQRMGRAGRRGEPAILRAYVSEFALDAKSPLMDRLRPHLVQTCAMLELLLQGWCEPPDKQRFHFSTCVQQLLSLIAQYGGLRAGQLWQMLAEQGAFKQMIQRDFLALLRSLGENGLITQMDNGTLLLDTQGEQLVNHYSFYAAFQTPEEYRLISDGQTLGSLPVDMPVYPDVVMIFAGRRWVVINVDDEAKVIELRPSSSGLPPKFGSGGAMIHERVRQEMRKLYLSESIPVYLNAGGREMLQEARTHFRLLGLDKAQVIQDGQNVFVFPWSSDKSLFTLGLRFQQQGYPQTYGESFALQIEKASQEHIQGLWEDFKHQPVEPLSLLYHLELANLQAEKHDEYVPAELLKKEFVVKYFETQHL